ncbi:MAG: methionyl-tRNA formyltransferase [Candidatus Acidiferrales bacterium]
MPLRIIFCGTPAFGLPTLQFLLKESHFSVEAVFTQPDRPRGRGQEAAQSPIKEAALRPGIPVHQPEKMRSEAAAELMTQIKPDAAVIIAYGQMIPRALLDIPRLGWINLHGSLLPKYRGAAPVQRAILNGEQQTGLTTMRIDAGLDTGPILEQLPVNIGPDETATELLVRMSNLGAPMMLDTLRKLDRGEITPKPQDNSLATLAPPLKKEEGLIDWAQPASAIHNRIRAFDPWPGTYTQFRGRSCHIWGRPSESDSAAAQAQCGTIVQKGQTILVACGQSTWLQLESVRLEGRKRVTATEFANGARLTTNDRFTS